MGVLGKIFSSGAGKLVKNVGGVLDNLTTSTEEKLKIKSSKIQITVTKSVKIIIKI